MAKSSKRAKFSKGKIYLYAQTVKRPYSGEVMETRTYALGHVVYRMAFGKTPMPDLKASEVDSWSSTKDTSQLAAEYEKQGYTVAYA